MTITNETIGELYLRNTNRAADYAGALGFSRGTLNLILKYVKENDIERIESLAHEALEEIENIFIKHQINLK
jgi:hypothetical protein